MYNIYIYVYIYIYMSDRMPDTTTGRMSNSMSVRMPAQVSAEVSEGTSDKMPQFMSERMPNRMSEYTSEKMSLGADHSKKVILGAQPPHSNDSKIKTLTVTPKMVRPFKSQCDHTAVPPECFSYSTDGCLELFFQQGYQLLLHVLQVHIC